MNVLVYILGAALWLLMAGWMCMGMESIGLLTPRRREPLDPAWGLRPENQRKEKR